MKIDQNEDRDILKNNLITPFHALPSYLKLIWDVKILNVFLWCTDVTGYYDHSVLLLSPLCDHSLHYEVCNLIIDIIKLIYINVQPRKLKGPLFKLI